MELSQRGRWKRHGHRRDVRRRAPPNPLTSPMPCPSFPPLNLSHQHRFQRRSAAPLPPPSPRTQRSLPCQCRLDLRSLPWMSERSYMKVPISFSGLDSHMRGLIPWGCQAWSRLRGRRLAQVGRGRRTLRSPFFKVFGSITPVFIDRYGPHLHKLTPPPLRTDLNHLDDDRRPGFATPGPSIVAHHSAPTLPRNGLL